MQPHAHHRARDSRNRAPARRHADRHAHHRLGLPLAARLPARVAGQAAGRHRLTMASTYDNLGRQSAQSGASCRRACSGAAPARRDGVIRGFSFVDEERERSPHAGHPDLQQDDHRRHHRLRDLTCSRSRPTMPSPRRRRAAASGMGMVNNAVRHFELSAALKPEAAAVHFNLGTARAQAAASMSIESFRTALKPRPDYALAHGNLVMAAGAGSGGRYTGVIQQEAVRLDPSNPRSLLGLAEAQAARGAYAMARSSPRTRRSGCC